MSYDGWKCSAPEVDDAPDHGADEPTCDCGAPIDHTTGVSMCRECYESCEPVTEWGDRLDSDREQREALARDYDTVIAVLLATDIAELMNEEKKNAY